MQATLNKPNTLKISATTGAHALCSAQASRFGCRSTVPSTLLALIMLVIAGCGDRSSDSEASVFIAGNQQAIEPNPSEGVIGLFPNNVDSDDSSNTSNSETDNAADSNSSSDSTDNDTDNDTDSVDSGENATVVIDMEGGQDANVLPGSDLPTDQGDASNAAMDSNEGNGNNLIDDIFGDSDFGNMTGADQVSDAAALPVVINLAENVNQLSLEGIEFDQIFQSQQLSYTASVPYLTSSTTLLVNGQEVQDLALLDGTNTVLLQSPGNGPVYVLSIERELRENFASVAYIKDPASTLNTRFGTDISVDAGWMAILGRNVNQGVIMQRQQGSVWEQDQVLDAAGDSVSLDGDLLAVGDTMSGGREVPGFSIGIVRLFERGDSGWQQLAVVQASNGEDADKFGHSVAVSGDTLVVGAPGEDSGATGINADGSRNDALDAGAVYVFQRINPGQWVQQAYIKGDATAGGDRFGYSVAIDGERLVVGAVLEESSARGVGGDQLDNGRHGSGAAYVFERSEGNWRQRVYLKAANADADDRFGHAVDIAGSLVAVTAIAEDSGSLSDPFDNSIRDSGAVYLFDMVNNDWQQIAYLKASNPGDTDSFGHAVAIQSPERKALAVGAPNEDAIGSLLAGMPQDNSSPDNGAVYVFARNPDSATVWNEIIYLHADHPDAGDNFGSALAFEAGKLVVGAPGESSNPQNGANPADNSLAGAGAVYVFQ